MKQLEEKQDPVTAIVQIEQQGRAEEIKAQVILARQFPRDIEICRQKILEECRRPKLADKANYQYERGKDKYGRPNIIKGPSIRLAEVIARNWNNIKCGIRELGQHEGFSNVQAFAWDMESNVMETKDFVVPHYRKAKGVIYKLDDPRDIYEMVANQGARRKRACILTVIPGDIVDEAIEQADKTLFKALAGEDGRKRLKKMLDMFAEYDVTRELIEQKFNKKINNLPVEDIATLVYIYNSIKDGIGSPADYFNLPKENVSEETKELEKDLKKRGRPKKKKPEEPENESQEDASRFQSWSELTDDEIKNCFKALRDLYKHAKIDLERKGYESLESLLAHFQITKADARHMTAEQYHNVIDYIRASILNPDEGA